MKLKKVLLLLLLLLPVLLGSGCTAYYYAMCQSKYKGDAIAAHNTTILPVGNITLINVIIFACIWSEPDDTPLPPRRAEEIIRGIRFTPYTPKTIRDERKFLAELEEVRKNGFACDRGEEMEDLRCVAAPIRDIRRGTVSAVWITGPASRLTEAKMKKYAVLVRKTALQIEDKIN